MSPCSTASPPSARPSQRSRGRSVRGKGKPDHHTICATEPHKELVFFLNANDVPSCKVDLPPGLHFGEVIRWEDLPTGFRNIVTDPSSGFQWNGRDWFGKNRRLWVGTQDGQVVALGWWVGYAEAVARFFPVPEDAELMIHAVVLPEFRGKNLQRSLWMTLMQSRVDQDIRSFYVHVNDYNYPSLATIRRLGFRHIACTRRNRFTGKRSWISIPQRKP